MSAYVCADLSAFLYSFGILEFDSLLTEADAFWELSFLGVEWVCVELESLDDDELPEFSPETPITEKTTTTMINQTHQTLYHGFDGRFFMLIVIPPCVSLYRTTNTVLSSNNKQFKLKAIMNIHTMYHSRIA